MLPEWKPLFIWFNREPDHVLPYSLLFKDPPSQECKTALHWYGKYPVPNDSELTNWDKFRRQTNIKCDCGCVSEAVNKCYDVLLANNFQFDNDNGACDIIRKHFHITQDYTPLAIRVIREILIYAKQEERNVPMFISMRYGLDDYQAQTVLSHFETQEWFSHGTSASCPFITLVGIAWLNDNDTD